MTSRRTSVLILHNEPCPEEGACPESINGVLAEAAAVSEALARLHIPHRIAAVRDLQDCPAVLSASPEPVVFNLVEGFAAGPELASFVPAICAAFGKGCTGSDSGCLGLTLDKTRTKAVLAGAGLPVPTGVLVEVGAALDPANLPPPPWIVKPAQTDASEGITADASVCGHADALLRAVAAVHREFGQAALVEQLVGDRELNVAVLQRAGRVQVLPLAEIDFSAFPAGKPRIVDYAAKWLEDSFEYTHTPRIIPAPLPAATAEAIRSAALRAWRAVGCRDYARVDFRFSDNGEFHILEVNANPDISPDAGFAAALTAAGIDYAEFVAAITTNASVAPGCQFHALPLPNRSDDKRRTTNGNGGDTAAPVPAPEIRTSEPGDRDAIVALLHETQFFRDDEVRVACEVLDDALRDGPTGHYQSLCATLAGVPVGWACYGPTPCTVGTFDLYWLAVHPEFQRHGIGGAMLRVAEDGMRARNARLTVVETSGTDRYGKTRRFYRGQGYQESARIPEFYATGDDKVICTKRLDTSSTPSCPAGSALPGSELRLWGRVP